MPHNNIRKYCIVCKKHTLSNKCPLLKIKLLSEIKTNNNNWIQKVSLLVMIYSHNSKFGG